MIAITGGIGSGKSFVCRLLEQRGIKIYDCDRAARHLINTDRSLQQRLDKAVGGGLFIDGRLDKSRLSRFILSSKANAQTVNSIVHPAVAKDFLLSGYTWMECALLFEGGFNERVGVDYVVCVTAPLDTRVERLMRRDGLSKEQAMEWINAQRSQEELLRLSDFEIKDYDDGALERQIDVLLATIINE